jgi:hypothetical protein
MPPVGSNLPDPVGTKLIHDWIASMPPATQPTKTPSPKGAD